MVRRPISITIIAWYLIISGILAVFPVFLMMSNKDPKFQEMLDKMHMSPALIVGMSVWGLVISVACGYGMLKGANWSRWVYVGWSAFGFLFSLITSPMKIMILPGLVIFAIIAYFIFNPRATKFFTQGASDAELV